MKKSKKAKKSRRSKGGQPMRVKKVREVQEAVKVVPNCGTCQHFILVGPNQRTCMYAIDIEDCKHYQSSLGGYSVRL